MSDSEDPMDAIDRLTAHLVAGQVARGERDPNETYTPRPITRRKPKKIPVTKRRASGEMPPAYKTDFF